MCGGKGAPESPRMGKCSSGWAVQANHRRRYRAPEIFKRNVSKNDAPLLASFSSSRFVQSQSQQAHGSAPFSCRQLRRACASLIASSSKYFSQYGRSSANGGSQKQVSTHRAVPSAATRACVMSYKYSSPAIEPLPSVFVSIARKSDSCLPFLTFALTR